jgi:hypothetical protein
MEGDKEDDSGFLIGPPPSILLVSKGGHQAGKARQAYGNFGDGNQCILRVHLISNSPSKKTASSLAVRQEPAAPFLSGPRQ